MMLYVTRLLIACNLTGNSTRGDLVTICDHCQQGNFDKQQPTSDIHRHGLTTKWG